jgi:CheY-like chemotaxis protein
MSEDPSQSPQIHILLVEDNELDARASLRAAARLKIRNTIDHVTDGTSALEYLRGGTDERPLPDLILLDLDLPGISGFDVLAEVKADPSLASIPVVILTTSDRQADIVGAYDSGASAYVSKPAALDGWIEVVRQIDGFWLSVLQTPPT